MLLQILLSGPLLFSISGAEKEICDSGPRELTNLWAIKSQPTSYLFGTMHFNIKFDDVSAQAQKAFKWSEKTFFETSSSADPENRKECPNPMKKELPKELTKRVERYIERAREQLKDDPLLASAFDKTIQKMDWKKENDPETLRKSQYQIKRLNFFLSA